MRRRTLLATAPILAAATAVPAQAALNDTLRPYLSRYKFPALAAAVVHKGDIIAAGAVGKRRLDQDIQVTINDRFHIGSDTKAMTSLLAGMMVEAGKLRWNSTVGEAYPELADTMDAGLKGVTLDQLLSHTSGIPSDTDTSIKLFWDAYMQDGVNLDGMRYWIVRQIAGKPLGSKPGAEFHYANLGFILAGNMIERVGGATFEELVTQRIFDPLRLSTAGFGPQATVGRTDATFGHAQMDDGPLKPMLPGPNGDAPAVIGPAGTAHLSILDFARWAGWQVAEGRRAPALVKPETMRKLHTPMIEIGTIPGSGPGRAMSGGYALGWGVVKVPFRPTPVLTHNGSNSMNFAMIMLDPRVDVGVVIATNCATKGADPACLALAEELFARFGG
jgi:CubicO group peptidase (beta-lactamase class C family)